MATTQTTSYTDLYHKIDHLAGREKQDFCKTLTLEEKKSYVKYCKEKDCEMVTGVFRCHEPAGGMLEMTAAAYEGETPTKYEFYDGLTYTIPRYLARRFENEFQGQGCWYPTNKYLLDANGKPAVHIGKKNRRFGFSSLDFQ